MVGLLSDPGKASELSKSELEYIEQDNEAPPVKQPFFTALKTVSKNKRFYGIPIPAFMAEPAWAVPSFWVPLYLAKSTGMDSKQNRHVGLAAAFSPPISAAWSAATSPACMFAGSAVRE